MNIPTPYETYIYSDIYEIPYNYIQEHNLIEITEKNFLRTLVKRPSEVQKKNIKKMEEETEQFMKGKNPFFISKFKKD